MGDFVEVPFFFFQICVKQIDEHNCQRDKRGKEGFPLITVTQINGKNAADDKCREHTNMTEHSSKEIYVFIAQRFIKGDSGLTNMVGAECRGHGNALRLAKRIVLHGADKVNEYLRNLIRGAFRQIGEENDNQHLNEN